MKSFIFTSFIILACITSSIIAEESDCEKEFKKKCGDELDDLHEALDDNKIIDTVKAASQIVKCAWENRKDLFEKCKPDDLNEVEMKYVLSAAATNVPKGPMTQDKDCDKVVEEFCGKEKKKLEDYLDEGASPKDIIKGSKDLIKCLIDHTKEIADKCGKSISIQTFVDDDESKCHKKLYDKCGKPLDKLEEAVDDFHVSDILKYAFKSVTCITEHLKEIIDACVDSDKKDIVPAIGPKYVALTDMLITNDDESKCHKKLYDMCGNDLDSLKKAIHNTSPTQILGSALNVAGCITSHFVKIVEACSPFQDIDADDDLMMIDGTTGSFPHEIKTTHFDFHQCVEVAKHAVIHQYFERRHHHHPSEQGENELASEWNYNQPCNPIFSLPGTIGTVIVFAIIAFAIGYRLGGRRQVTNEKSGYAPMLDRVPETA